MALLAETRDRVAVIEKRKDEFPLINDPLLKVREHSEEDTFPVLRCLPLVSGPGRGGDVGHELQVAAERLEVRCEVINVDNVGKPTSWARTPTTLSLFVGVGCLCSSWSCARWRRPGPPVLLMGAVPLGRLPSLRSRATSCGSWSPTTR